MKWLNRYRNAWCNPSINQSINQSIHPSTHQSHITSHLLCWASGGGATKSESYPMSLTWACSWDVNSTQPTNQSVNYLIYGEMNMYYSPNNQRLDNDLWARVQYQSHVGWFADEFGIQIYPYFGPCLYFFIGLHSWQGWPTKEWYSWMNELPL